MNPDTPELDPSLSDKGAVRGRPAASCSPLSVAYSREEMESKLREWMVKEFGYPRDYINDPDQRDAWYRDNGLIYHFICDHFPTENEIGMARRPINGGQPEPQTPPES